MEERLQKILARAGIASRRKAEELITAGRVQVNGKVLTTLGDQADPRRDRIVVNGQPLPSPAPLRHYLLYKPRGVVSTLSDPERRPTVAEFLPRRRGSSGERVFPVGRLDFASEGLLLITNDGDLAYRVLRASSALPKTYWVKVSGRPSEEQLTKMRRGLYLPALRSAPAVRSAPAQVRWRPGPPGDPNPWLEVVLTEGRPNQIRRMMQVIGHRVEKLRRVAIGPLVAAGLKPGQIRLLTPPELQSLRRALSPGRPGQALRPPASGGRARHASRRPVAATWRRPERQRTPAGDRRSRAAGPANSGAPKPQRRGPQRATGRTGGERRALGRSGGAVQNRAAEPPRRNGGLGPHPRSSPADGRRRGPNAGRDGRRFAAGHKAGPHRGHKPGRGSRSGPASGRR
ncbi:MAG: pseudouridine synthase [Terriglobales bacterium]